MAPVAERWDDRLAAWARRRLGAPFAWGETDCTLLVAEAVDLIAGTALAARYRGRWTSEADARTAERRHGADMVSVLREVGCEARNPEAGLRVGDVLVVRKPGWWCAHVCFGARSLSSSEGGVVGWCDTRALLDHGPLVLRPPVKTKEARCRP